MCGIFGIIGQNLNIEKNLESIAHRGPDDQGKYEENEIRLGFKRLSIIDLSEAGNQPMSNENGDIWIVCNGEIYNYQTLKKELYQKHNFRSNTDTEILIHGYEEWGIDRLLEKINGMFAFCIYDKKRGKIFLIRDRIGKKPLYYYENKNVFAFSSETKAFFKLDGFNFEINPEAFSLWIGFPYLMDNKITLISKVKKIPPAHYLTLNLKKGQYKIRRYYSIKNKKNKKTLLDNKKKLENLLDKSVQSRLVADVPLGILLSGGLDSSLITAIAAKYKPDLNTINISFPGTITDESKYAKIVSRHCQTQHIDLKIKIDNIFEDFEKNIWIYDDLSTPDGGLYSTYLLSKKIKEEGIKVALVGEGADEVFCGYTWFGFGQLPFKLLGNFIPILGYYYAIMRIFSKPKFFKYPFIFNQKIKKFSGDLFTKIQKNEILNSLPNHYCMKLDKGSSAASVETRTPYLDYKIVDFMANLPNNQKVKGNWYSNKKPQEKFILREIAKQYLPRTIYTRKKKGGMTPTYKILKDGLKEYRSKIVKNSIFKEYFSKNSLKRLIDSKPKIKPLIWQREWILWKLLIFQIWYEYYKQY